MARAVLKPIAFDTEAGVVEVPPGWTIATLLPLLNTSAAPGLQSWNPNRWHRFRLADASALASPMLVTALGHGRHSCPAQPFSLAAMTMAMSRLFGRFDMVPGRLATGRRCQPRRPPMSRSSPTMAAEAERSNHVHDIDIPEWAWSGCSSVALVVEIKTAPETVPNVNRLADLRAVGGTVDTQIITSCLTDVCCENHHPRRDDAELSGDLGDRRERCRHPTPTTTPRSPPSTALSATSSPKEMVVSLLARA